MSITEPLILSHYIKNTIKRKRNFAFFYCMLSMSPLLSIFIDEADVLML